MKKSPDTLKEVNWLFYGLIGLSLLVHAGILIHFSKGWFPRPSECIEISMENKSAPQSRDIPRPRLPRAVTHPEPLTGMNINQGLSLPDADLPPPPVFDAPNGAAVKVHAFSLPEPTEDEKPLPAMDYAKGAESDPRKDYFATVRLRIEEKKRYPESALGMNLEGQTTIDFFINPDGRADQISVVKSSGHPQLDQAALEAVQKSSPFPRPPGSVFKSGVQVRIPITFKLIQR